MKDCILICDKNCVTYKEVFPLIKQGKLSLSSQVKEYEGTDRKFGNHGWITTFPVHNKKKLVLTATYDPALYPKYDNYDAIEVSRIKNIPYDYDGVMGVPITILDYDLDDVDVLNCLNDNTPDTRTPTIKGKEKYTRILIKKNFEIEGAYNYSRDYDGNTWNAKVDGEYKYKRILIRRKDNDKHRCT